jgi:hypothetical protein
VYFVGLLQNVGQYPLERDAFYRVRRTIFVAPFAEPSTGIRRQGILCQLVLLRIPDPRDTIRDRLGSLVLPSARCCEPAANRVDVFSYRLVSFCMVSCGESLGIVFNTLIIDSTGFALNITSSLLSIAIIMAGEPFLSQISSFVPEMRVSRYLIYRYARVLQGANYISPGKYAAASMSIKAFTDFEFTCTDAQRLPDGSCPIQTGQQVLDLFNYHTSLASNIGALVAVTVAYRLIAYAVLRLSKADFGVTKKSSGLELEKV